MDTYHTHVWEPISDVPVNWKTSLASSNTASLVQAWQDQEKKLRRKDLYKNFVEKLKRRWAIETGVIEGLYSLSEGATLALIEKGLDAALISFDDTDRSPAEVIIKIKDQHQAIQGLYQFISGQRPLGTSYVKELHQVLTAHQESHLARDFLGNPVEAKLLRGEWKKWKNSVEHADGSCFEYCPPEQVASEMDRLLSLHDEHATSGVPADVEAAWLHHRFTLIHPFADGNGRVARCLATLVFLKANWLPLVVTRKDRADYIAALRAADDGNLKLLVDLFGSLQSKLIREALSLGDEVIQEATAVDEILQHVRERYNRQKAKRVQLFQESIKTADSLKFLASEELKEVAKQVQDTILAGSAEYRAFMYESRIDPDNSYYFHHQIVQTAKALGYFANRRRYQAWVALVIVTEMRTEILFSFHGIGHMDSGILGCSAMAYTKERGEEGETVIGEVIPLGNEPFQFAYLEEGVEVRQQFSKWLDERVIEGLKYWQREM